MANSKMTTSTAMNQNAQRTSWIITSSRTGLDEAVLSAVYTLSREVSRYSCQLQPAPVWLAPRLLVALDWRGAS